MKFSILFAFTVLACGIKVMLLPSYRSTDFEVHRNWIAITNSLPLHQWYFDEYSEWTLDYPPLFAYFQWVLSLFARKLVPEMVKVENLQFDSIDTVLFMKGSVILSDIFLFISTWLYVCQEKDMSSYKRIQLFLLVTFNAGLLLVDHIHFQYNGILMGLLVACIYFAKTKQYTTLAATYSILVLMKHLFLPLAPVFAIYLLQNHCYVSQSNADEKATNQHQTQKKSVFSFLKFGEFVLIALAILGFAFYPFVSQLNGKEQLLQIFSRLFPFGRGLVHAYWAPNIWALYCAGDKIIAIIVRRFSGLGLQHLLLKEAVQSGTTVLHNSTSGKVGDFLFSILPSVSPKICILLMFMSIIPAMFMIQRRPTPRMLIHTLVYTSLTTFMLGYHVHEKAVIIPLILQTFVSIRRSSSSSNNNSEEDPGMVKEKKVTTNSNNKNINNNSNNSFPSSESKDDFTMLLSQTLFAILAIVGIYSLFPLFFTLPELLTKSLIYATYISAVWLLVVKDISKCAFGHDQNRLAIYAVRLIQICLASMITVYIFAEIVHPFLSHYKHMQSKMDWELDMENSWECGSTDTCLNPSKEEWMPFLPRMLTSTVCAMYLVVAWFLSAVIMVQA